MPVTFDYHREIPGFSPSMMSDDIFIEVTFNSNLNSSLNQNKNGTHIYDPLLMHGSLHRSRKVLQPCSVFTRVISENKWTITDISQKHNMQSVLTLI